MLAAASKHQPFAVAVGRNTLWGFVSRGVQISTRLITIPVVISHLGLSGYGIWSIIMTTAAYMRFGSVGIKSAFQKYVAEATGNGDYERANKLLSTGSAIMFLLSMAALVPISLFARKISIVAGVTPEFLDSASAAVSMLAVIMVLSNTGAVFEAIVMGGHRIDLTRIVMTVLTVAEAIGIIVVLQMGYGLFAMASIMALSEIGFVAYCYVASKTVVPQIRLRRTYITRTVLHELVRYAGTYQLVNVMEVIYAAILPVTILKTFGAAASGEYALVTKLVTSVLMLSDAFFAPVLSGGSKIYASGSSESMAALIRKSFKVMFGLTLVPLPFIAVFGPEIILAWTGQVNASFQVSLWLVAAAGVFSNASVLQLVLYRISGKALIDNFRQLLRIATLLIIALFAATLGYYGTLAGLVVADAAGALLMLFAMTHTFHEFKAAYLLSDIGKMAMASVLMIAAAYTALYVPLPASLGIRTAAMFQLGIVACVWLLVGWPACRMTNAITSGESRALLAVISPYRFSSL